jgi:hypothetical protein
MLSFDQHLHFLNAPEKVALLVALDGLSLLLAGGGEKIVPSFLFLDSMIRTDFLWLDGSDLFKDRSLSWGGNFSSLTFL